MHQNAHIPSPLAIGVIDEDGFKLIFIDPQTQGQIWRHEKVLETVDDYSHVYEIATDKARKAQIVKILPILNQNDPLRATLFAGAKQNKCPDMNVDGEFLDVKTIEGGLSNANINNNVKKAKAQANHVVIRIPGEVSYWRLEFISKKRFELHSSLEIIEFKLIGHNKNYTFRRKDCVTT